MKTYGELGGRYKTVVGGKWTVPDPFSGCQNHSHVGNASHIIDTYNIAPRTFHGFLCLFIYSFIYGLFHGAIRRYKESNGRRVSEKSAGKAVKGNGSGIILSTNFVIFL
jgi:hypothetical protein